MLKYIKRTAVCISILLTIGCTNVLGATNWPSYNDFTDSRNGVTSQTYADATKVYTALEDSKLAVYWGGEASNSNINVYKNFDVPFTAGELAIEYEMCWQQGYIYAYRYCPALIDSEGNASALAVTRQDGNVYIGGNINNNTYLLPNFKWVSGNTYKLRFICDFNKLTFKMYVDSLDGNGYVQQFTQSGVGEMPLNVSNVSKIHFSFDKSSDTRLCKATIDNLNVYPISESSVFISNDGDDLNDGSFYSPLESLDTAIEKNADNIYLKDGEYTFDENYTYGHLDRNLNKFKIPFIPYTGVNIKVSGNYTLDVPDIDNFPISQEYKDGLKQLIINSDYVPSYYSRPLNIEKMKLIYNETTETIDTSVTIKSTSIIDSDAVLVIALYKNSSLDSLITATDKIYTGKSLTLSSSIEVPDDFFTEDYTVKSFLWNDFISMIPLIDTTSYSNYVINADIDLTGSHEIECSTVNNNFIINGKGIPNKELTVCIVNASGEVVYLNQKTVDANGDFSINCKVDKLTAQQYTIHIYNGLEGINQ